MRRLRRLLASALAVLTLGLLPAAAHAQFTVPGVRPHASHGQCYGINSSGVIVQQTSPCTTGFIAVPVRGTAIYSVGGTSITVTWPTNTAANDFAVICTASSWGSSTPTGWTQIQPLSGSQYVGACYYKTLNSTDISTGNVVISFGGSGGITAGIVTFVGNQTIRTSNARRGNPTASTNTLPAAITASPGDAFFLYTSNLDPSSTDTINFGTQNQQVANGNGGGVLNTGNVYVTTNINPTYSYSNSGNGLYGYYLAGFVIKCPTC